MNGKNDKIKGNIYAKISILMLGLFFLIYKQGYHIFADKVRSMFGL